VFTAVEVLQGRGSSLGRPFVDGIKRSRHANMKELRPLGGHVRVLFAFDPLRSAILLVGGDKTNQRLRWYDVMVPMADRLYDDHLATLKEEGRQP